MTHDKDNAQVSHLLADRLELMALMDACCRPQVKGRIGEFVAEMDNQLSRLQGDPFELDEEEIRELRRFQISKASLPGAVHDQNEGSHDGFREDKEEIRAVSSSVRQVRCQSVSGATWWDDGGAAVFVRVQIVGVERLPLHSISCRFYQRGCELHVLDEACNMSHTFSKVDLWKNIVPEKSTFTIERNRIVLQLFKASALNVDSGGIERSPRQPPQFSVWKRLCCANDDGIFEIID